MFNTEEKICKNIITDDGEDEFQIRYSRDENVGVITSRSNKSYLILDSIDYWYDLIQEKYPSKLKCSCKNEFFKLTFNYIPRIGTDDYRAVELITCCTVCGKQKKLSEIDIDYSPTSQLFEQPITYCEQPKIKYKTYSLKGYWKEEIFCDLIDFLLQKRLWVYCLYWDKAENKRCVKQMSADELKGFLFTEKSRYISVFFSASSLDELFTDCIVEKNGIYVDRDLWRKQEIIKLNAPILVATGVAGELFYSMDFCSEYIEKGQIKAKSDAFCELVKEFLAYSKKKLK